MSTRAQEYDNYLDYLDDYIAEKAAEKAEKRAVDQERAGPPDPPDPLDREEAEQANDDAPFCDQCTRPILGEVWVTIERGRILCYRCWEECDETAAYRLQRARRSWLAGRR